MKLSKYLVGTALAGIMFAAAASPANATLIIRLTDNLGNTQTVADGSANDLNGAPNAINLDTSFQGFTFSIQSLDNASQTGFAPVYAIHMNTQAVGQSVIAPGSTLLVELTATNLDPLTAGIFDIFSGISNTSLNGTVTYTSWFNTSNTAFGHEQLVFTGTNTGPNQSQGGTLYTQSIGAQYSITQQYLLTMNPGQGQDSNVNGSMEIHVPEPGTMAVLGAALVAFGAVRRRTARS